MNWNKVQNYERYCRAVREEAFVALPNSFIEQKNSGQLTTTPINCDGSRACDYKNQRGLVSGPPKTRTAWRSSRWAMSLLSIIVVLLACRAVYGAPIRDTLVPPSRGIAPVHALTATVPVAMRLSQAGSVIDSATKGIGDAIDGAARAFGINRWFIVGIVIATAIAVLMLIICCCFYCCRPKSKK